MKRPKKSNSYFQVNSGVFKMNTLSAREKLVYVTLCSFADNETGECFPSIHTIAATAHLNYGTVFKALGQLEVMELIRIDRRLGQGNYYMLLDHRSTKNTPKRSNIVPFASS